MVSRKKYQLIDWSLAELGTLGSFEMGCRDAVKWQFAEFIALGFDEVAVNKGKV